MFRDFFSHHQSPSCEVSLGSLGVEPLCSTSNKFSPGAQLLCGRAGRGELVCLVMLRERERLGSLVNHAYPYSGAL